MGFSWVDLILFAQDAAPAAEAPAPMGPSPTQFLIPIVLTMAFFYFMIVLPDRKRTKSKQELVDTLKKNDKVLTIGGIIGVVANVKPGDDEIVLKIDEDKDVKIRVTKSSIAQVLTAKTEEASGEK